MRRLLAFVSLLAIVAACGDSPVTPVQPPKPDPYITVRVRNGLDTTTAPGRALWRVYALLSGPYVNQNGVSYQGVSSLADVRGHHIMCMAIGSDSIGQRLFAPLAIADTTTETARPDAAYDSLVTRWNAGNHAALPAGFMLITRAPADAWDSQQYADGHGLVHTDPIKWTWDWSGSGASVFAERAYSDTTSCNTA